MTSQKEYDEAMAYDLKQDFKNKKPLSRPIRVSLSVTVLNEAKRYYRLNNWRTKIKLAQKNTVKKKPIRNI